MNHSLLCADSATYAKIVSMALVGAIAVVAIGIAARIDARSNGSVAVVKAGTPAVFSRSDMPAIR
jgi:hypothetical protein